MSLSVDDLLKEFDDLPGGSKGAGRGVRAAAPAQPVQRDSLPTPSRPQTTRTSTPASTSQTSAPVGNRSTSSGKKDDLEALLSDLDFGGTPYNSMNGRNNPRAAAAAEAAVQKLSIASRTSSVISSKQKCTGIFIGGTSFARGRMGAVGTLTCCDALRCTKAGGRPDVTLTLSGAQAPSPLSPPGHRARRPAGQRPAPLPPAAQAPGWRSGARG
jgi:hypothetical protein